MSIDKANRNRIADAIDAYLRCEIDNFELDGVLFNAEDRAAFEIAREAWFFYDDCKRHKNAKRRKLPEPAEARLRRWVLFLRSDTEWPLEEPDPRTRWHGGGRWQGILKPIGCIVALMMLPITLFEVIVLGYPRPRSVNNEFWPFQSVEDWTRFGGSR